MRAPRRLALVRAGVALGLAAFVAALVLVHQLGARPPRWYPPCWFHEATGLHCPGCGTARAVHALGQGAVMRALDQNLFAVAMLPVLVVWAVASARNVWRTGRGSWALPTGWAWGVLVFVVIFTLARNLPWWPFALLAPE